MRALRVLLLVLVASVAWGGMLPVVARLVADVDHVCHCSASTHDCVCARCQPERPDLWVTEASLKGQCGDDDGFPAARAFRGLVPAPNVVLPAPSAVVLLSTSSARPHPTPPRSPPVPPPEAPRPRVLVASS